LEEAEKEAQMVLGVGQKKMLAWMLTRHYLEAKNRKGFFVAYLEPHTQKQRKSLKTKTCGKDS
jgi:hypothetical protein